MQLVALVGIVVATAHAWKLKLESLPLGDVTAAELTEALGEAGRISARGVRFPLASHLSRPAGALPYPGGPGRSNVDTSSPTRR